MRVEAPFTDEQVKHLNDWQERGDVHPFTCPGDRPECAEGRELFATRDGWVCRCAEYCQFWAHDFMAGGQ
ncbi:hypothetical protein ELH77_19155 [Rhizobium ruizarguesonis]|uniref:hypothetical protein n=1 Tax=Rhizobium ruizarguesonis TaxID=2081791 RepID=UPI00102F5469|nr:hypothetical protein [Rhizobium ruizarguesonis]TAZ20725.1 hypothetical protein ELH77_19155 [Rhizobium ruizarguesonis]